MTNPSSSLNSIPGDDDFGDDGDPDDPDDPNNESPDDLNKNPDN